MAGSIENLEVTNEASTFTNSLKEWAVETHKSQLHSPTPFSQHINRLQKRIKTGARDLPIPPPFASHSSFVIEI